MKSTKFGLEMGKRFEKGKDKIGTYYKGFSLITNSSGIIEDFSVEFINV